MLALLRRKVRSPFVLAALAIIILVFIFWLPQMGGERGPITVATVNDQALSYLEFQRRHDAILSQYREQLGGTIPAELLAALNLRQQVINQMIEEALLLQSAEDTGLSVSAKELRQTIHNMREFHQDGTFNLDLYKRILASLRLSSQEFEAGIHRDLLQFKIANHLASFAQISELEVRERFHRDHDEVRISYLALNPADFRAGIQPGEEEIAAHHQQHSARFSSEPMVRLDYILFAVAAEAVEVSAEEISAHYAANLERYSIPEQRRVSHILIRSRPDDPAKLRQERRQEAEMVWGLAQKRGDDFAALARRYSEDDSAAAGGDLGFFQRGEILEPIERAAFQLKVGEISQVVETAIGFHLIKLTAIRPGTISTLEQVSREIELELRKNKGRQLAFSRANEVYEKILTTGSLARGAEAAGVSAASTSLFALTQAPISLAQHPEVITAAFALRQGELSSIITTEAGYAIIFVQERQEPHVLPLAEARPRVEADLIDIQAKEAARHRAEEILTAARAGADMRQQAPANQQVQKSAWFSRTTVGGVDLPAEVSRAALELSQANPFPTTVKAVNGLFYVIKLVDQRVGDERLFADWRGQIQAMLELDKREAIGNTWVNHLRGQAKIEITPGTATSP